MKLLITESQLKNIHENSANNPYKERWKYERTSLKNFLLNNGEVMLSKENGKYYKVVCDSFLSNLIGINYCICIQFDSITNEIGDIIYVRAYDKFKKV